MASSTPKSEKSNRGPDWKLMITVISLLVGGGIFWKIYDLVLESRAPGFTVSAVNTLEGKNVYELTNFLIWNQEPPGLKLNLGLEIRPVYYGKPLGEVQVVVKNKDGMVLAHHSWKSLNKGSEPLRLVFDSAILSSIVEVQPAFYQQDEEGYIYPKSDLAVEVSRISDPGHPLYTDTLAILNTPWYHFSRVVPNLLGQGLQNVDIFVQGRNLGAPSEFMILTEVYEINDIAGRPYAPWPKVYWTVNEVGKVDRDAEFTARISLLSGQIKFDPGKCYAIKTFAIKKQNYVEFQGAGWKDSGEAWRFGDLEDYSLVCYPTQ
jgi:hypothetical protein